MKRCQGVRARGALGRVPERDRKIGRLVLRPAGALNEVMGEAVGQGGDGEAGVAAGGSER